MLPAPKRVETTQSTQKETTLSVFRHETSPKEYRCPITRTHMKAPFTLRYVLRARRVNTRDNTPPLDSGVS